MHRPTTYKKPSNGEHRPTAVKRTSGADVQLAEVHMVHDRKLHNDVSGQRQVGVSALETDRRTCFHGTRVLATHRVVVQHGCRHLYGYVRQTDDEVARSVV